MSNTGHHYVHFVWQHLYKIYVTQCSIASTQFLYLIFSTIDMETCSLQALLNQSQQDQNV